MILGGDHLPKGTTIFKMVVDFQGKNKENYHSILSATPDLTQLFSLTVRTPSGKHTGTWGTVAKIGAVLFFG